MLGYVTIGINNLDDSIAALERSAQQNNLVAALRTVRRMVPEFKPSDTLMEFPDSQ